MKKLEIATKVIKNYQTKLTNGMIILFEDKDEENLISRSNAKSITFFIDTDGDDVSKAYRLLENFFLSVIAQEKGIEGNYLHTVADMINAKVKSLMVLRLSFHDYKRIMKESNKYSWISLVDRGVKKLLKKEIEKTYYISEVTL